MIKIDGFFSDINFKKKEKPVNQQFNKKIVSDLLFKNLGMEPNFDLIDFIRHVIIQREKLKFEFTKNLSDALELITKAGKELGFTRMN